ncbi:MAG: thioredoxin family protein [Planctomycetota bacterium]
MVSSAHRHRSLATRIVWRLLPLLAMIGCQQSDIDSVRSLADVDQQLLVERGGLQFVADSKVGLHLAAKQKTPCLMFFTAEWCTFCHQMEATAFADPAITQLAEQFVCVLIDADREPAVCQQFDVRGYPTVQFVSSDGRQLHSLVGKQSPTQLASGMQAALERLAWLDQGVTR